MEFDANLGYILSFRQPGLQSRTLSQINKVILKKEEMV